MSLRLMQRHGVRPVALMGGGTTRIGDPSFREEARQLLSDEQIAVNMAGSQAQSAAVPDLRATAPPTRSCPTTPSGSTGWATSSCCARSACISRSTACCPSTAFPHKRLEREQGLTFLEFNYSIPAELRLPGVVAAVRGGAANGRLGSMGQHRLGRRSGAADGRQDGVRTDHAAHRHRLRPEDGQIRERRGVAERRTGSLRTITGSSGATRRTPMSAASCACSPICRSMTRHGWRHWPERRSTRPRRSSPRKATALAHGRAAAEAAAEAARRAFEAGEASALPGIEVASAELAAGISRRSPVRRSRPVVEQRGGAPPDPRRAGCAI